MQRVPRLHPGALIGEITGDGGCGGELNAFCGRYGLNPTLAPEPLPASGSEGARTRMQRGGGVEIGPESSRSQSSSLVLVLVMSASVTSPQRYAFLLTQRAPLSWFRWVCDEEDDGGKM